MKITDHLSNVYADMENLKSLLEASEKRNILNQKKELSLMIEETYEDVVSIYKDMDERIKAEPHRRGFYKNSYASRVGAIVHKRNRLKKELENLNG